jgi:hypothetical protein
MATSLISSPRIKAVILSEAGGQRSRENVVLVHDGAVFQSGTLLTKSGDAATTGSAAATAGNTGNPTFGTINVGAAGIPGAYKVRFTAATKFDVEDPNGVTIGTGTTGVAFSKKGLGFTLTAGGTPAVAGDEFTITVAEGTGKYSRYAAAGASGPADAVLYNHCFAKTALDEEKVVGFVRDCELNRYELTGLDATGEADLKAKGMVVRGTAGLPTVSTPTLS